LSSPAWTGPAVVTIFALEGEIVLEAGGGLDRLTNGVVAALDGGVRHAVQLELGLLDSSRPQSLHQVSHAIVSAGAVVRTLEFDPAAG
jgi:hypothetical protein